MPCDNFYKILFCSENGTPASFSTRALPFGSVFSSPYWKTEKNLSGNCLGTNLESLESLNNIYPRPFHSVVWKEKKLTHKSSPPVKIGSPFIIVNSIWFVSKKLAQSQRGRGGYSTSFIRDPALALTPCPLINHFSRKRFPFHLPCIDKWYPFILSSFLELFFPFNCCECNVF